MFGESGPWRLLVVVGPSTADGVPIRERAWTDTVITRGYRWWSFGVSIEEEVEGQPFGPIQRQVLLQVVALKTDFATTATSVHYSTSCYHRRVMWELEYVFVASA